jgi:hypothetical protein
MPVRLVVRGVLEEEVDAGHLEVAEEGHVVDVLVGVHVRPAHRDAHGVPHARHPALRPPREGSVETQITEIAPDVYRLSTYVSDANLVFNQFLVDAEEPLLFHAGLSRG